MIPKIVHYIWFGDQAKKPIDRINSWRDILSGWEICEWNETNLNLNKYRFSKFAYDLGEYGIAIDPFRAELLNDFGGVWLDTDVVLYKDLSPFLSYSFFAGYESRNDLSNGLVGTESNFPAISRLISWFKEKWNNENDTPATPQQVEIIHSRLSSPGDELTRMLTREYRIIPNGKSETYGTVRLEAVPVFTIRGDYGYENYAVHLLERSWCVNRRLPSYASRVKEYENFVKINRI